MANFDNQLIESRSYVKSNEMVSAKYNSSLLENQVMAIALTRIEENVSNLDNPLEARLYPGELKRLVSDDAHIYRDLKKLAKSITGHTMFLEDGKGNFKAFSVVPNADYIDGVFVIKFNSVLKEHLLGMDKNFTTLEISVMTNFKRNSSFRIYELLKKDIYRSNPKVNEGRVDVEYNLFEFRFMIGIANADNTDVKKYTDNISVVDWEEAYRILEEKGSRSDIKYRTTDKLQKDCLKPAQEELEQKSDIRFEFELVRIGRSYKKIVFHIYKNVPQNETEIVERVEYVEKMNMGTRQLEVPMDMYPDLYNDYVGHNKLAAEDITLLLKKAQGSEERVRRAIEMADKQDSISNYMGWLIRAIENDYAQVETMRGSADLADAAREAVSAIEADKEGVARKVWERAKSKEDFEDFKTELELQGYSVDQLEVIYEMSELTQAYTNWKLGKGIIL